MQSKGFVPTNIQELQAFVDDHIAMAQFDEAREMVERALTIYPRNPKLMRMLARIASTEGNMRLAQDLRHQADDFAAARQAGRQALEQEAPERRTLLEEIHELKDSRRPEAALAKAEEG